MRDLSAGQDGIRVDLAGDGQQRQHENDDHGSHGRSDRVQLRPNRSDIASKGGRVNAPSTTDASEQPLVIGHPTMSIPGCLATGYRTAITASEAALIRPASRRCRRATAWRDRDRPSGWCRISARRRHRRPDRIPTPGSRSPRSSPLHPPERRGRSLHHPCRPCHPCRLLHPFLREHLAGPADPVPRPALERLECPGCPGRPAVLPDLAGPDRPSVPDPCHIRREKARCP